MNEELNIHTERLDDSAVIVVLSGRFMAIHADQVKTVFGHLVNGQPLRVVVDMTGVSFIDSAGLSALVSGLKQVRRTGGDLVLAGVQPQTRTVFNLTMLDQVFSIFTDREAALLGAESA